MARNEEKSHSMLNKWLTMKKEKAGQITTTNRRPPMATNCHSLPQAEKWRSEILREIGKKVSEIQNASLPEHRVRELNDEINKQLRVKNAWEDQIRLLGGPNYRANSTMRDQDGREVPQVRGYQYFGAARNLPGVKELFTKKPRAAPKRTRGDLWKAVDPQYYGLRDDDDGVLEQLEESAEDEIRKKMKASYEREVAAEEEANADSESRFVSFVPIPSTEDIEKLILEKKKADLLAKYVSPSQAESEKSTKKLVRGA